MHVDLIREILASHESGISRDGLLAWARLRGDPQMTDAQLDAALAALGDQVVDVQGFLYLRQHAPASALADTPPAVTPPPAAPPAWPPAAVGAPPPAWPQEGAGVAPPPPPGTGAGGWLGPDGDTTAPEGGWTPEPSPGGRRMMIIASIGVLGFVLAAGVGAFLLRNADGGAEPVDATPAVPTPTSGSVVDAFDIVVGDCLVLPSEDEFDEVRRLACTEPHDGEVFFVEDYPDAEYPAADDFSSYVDAECLPAFQAYTGSDFEGQDVLDIGWFAPTQGSWESGDREVACYLTPVAGQTSQSFRDANP
jgi:hypothetical protein